MAEESNYRAVIIPLPNIAPPSTDPVSRPNSRHQVLQVVRDFTIIGAVVDEADEGIASAQFPPMALEQADRAAEVDPER